MINPSKLSGKVASVAITGVLALSPIIYPMSAFAYQGYDSESQVLADKSLSDKEKNAIIAGINAEKEAKAIAEAEAAKAAEAQAAAEAKAAEEAAAAEAKAVETAQVDKTTIVAEEGTSDLAISEKSSTKEEVKEVTEIDSAVTEEKTSSKEDSKAVDSSNAKKEEAKNASNEEKKTTVSEKNSTNEKTTTTTNAVVEKNSIASNEAVKTAKEEAKVNATKVERATKESTKIKNINELKNKAVEADSNAVNPSFGYTQNNSGYVSRHEVNLTTETFIASIGPIAQILCQDNDMYASVMIAQAIIESGSGSSGLSKAPNFNLFGIKGYGTDGKTVNMATSEDAGDGTNYNTRANFAAYNNHMESLEAYVDLIANNGAHYYDGALKSNTNDYKDACNYLQGRYATSTIYAQTLINTIETYDLTRYDKKLDYKIVGKIYDPEWVVENGGDLEATRGMRDLTMKDYANLLATATSRIGTPYVWGGTDPENGVDCSGFVMTTYRDALQMETTRTTYTMQHKGVEVNFDDLRMGDLVFFNDNGDTNHVGMYIGDGFYIESTRADGIDGVRITAMEHRTPQFAKRIIEFEEIEKEETTVEDSDDVKADEKNVSDDKFKYSAVNM